MMMREPSVLLDAPARHASSIEVVQRPALAAHLCKARDDGQSVWAYVDAAQENFVLWPLSWGH